MNKVVLNITHNTNKVSFLNLIKRVCSNYSTIKNEVFSKELPFETTLYFIEENMYTDPELYDKISDTGVEIQAITIKPIPLNTTLLEEEYKFILSNLSEYKLTRDHSYNNEYKIESSNGGFIIFEDERIHDELVRKLLLTEILRESK